MQDIPKMCTALAEWLSCITILLIYRDSVSDKKNIMRIGIITGTGVGLGIIQFICGKLSGIFWNIGMAGAIFLMAVLIKYGLEIKWKMAFYLCAKAFMLAELLAALEWQLYSFYFGKWKGNIFLEAGSWKLHDLLCHWLWHFLPWRM